MKKLALLFLSLVVIGSQNIAFAAKVSFDQLATSADLTVSKYNNDLQTIFNKANSTIQTDNIQDNTLQDLPVSSDFATNSSPRTRTLHGAACEFVFEGLTPATDSDLTSDISTGTAYPQGYYCTKTSATSNTYTAERDTYVDIDQNCDFQFTAVSNGANAPSVATNSIRVAKVITSLTAITTVTDLAKRTCTQASYDQVTNGTFQASLDDIFRFGKFRASQDTALVYGAHVSFDTATQFKVTPGAAFFTQNQQYRGTSTDISVPTTADSPSAGTSGGDGSSLSANSKVYVYLAADQQDDPDYSVTWSTNSSAPTGVTNYRKIGVLRTDANSNFSSADMNTTHKGGRLLQRKVAFRPGTATLTTTFTPDTSAWTTSEGTKVVSVSIDPIYPGSWLDIEAQGYFGEGSTTAEVGGAIIRNGDTNAIGTCQSGNVTTGPVGQSFTCKARQKAHTTGTRTYDFYAGPDTAATVYLNGLSGGANFAETHSTYIQVEEIEET